MNKYGARKTYSELCGREFDSKKEAARGEELHLLQLAGEITDLEYQPRFILNGKPRVTYKPDFRYKENGKEIVEDAKGYMTRDCRLRIIWLKQLQGIEIRIT